MNFNIGDLIYQALDWIWQQLRSMVGFYWQQFYELYQYLFYLLDPWNRFGGSVLALADSLPFMDPGTPLFIESLLAGSSTIIGYLSILSYFVDLNAFVATFAFLAIAEIGILPYRAWLTIKRAIPVIG